MPKQVQLGIQVDYNHPEFDYNLIEQLGWIALNDSIYDVDLRHEWMRFITKPGMVAYYDGTKEGFRNHIRAMLVEPSEADDFTFCENCYTPEHDDDAHVTGDETTVCDRCFVAYYRPCTDCGEFYSSLTGTLGGSSVCDGCLDDNWYWCEYCDGYDGNTHDHDDDDDEEDRCDCVSPAQTFTIPNDGEEPLTNDTRIMVTLPAGIISKEGLDEIKYYLRGYHAEFDQDMQNGLYNLSAHLDELGDKWQAKRGNYTKRLSQLAYSKLNLKVPPKVLSTVGTIARNHSTAVDFAIETTRNLNLSAYDFYHEDSCWWQSYSYSRCALKTNGGFGIRTFGGEYQGEVFGDDDVSGRVWVMPLKLADLHVCKRCTARFQVLPARMGACCWSPESLEWVDHDIDTVPQGSLVPTFETQDPAAYVVFNGYGMLSGYTPARLLSYMVGMTYRKIAFGCSPMYVNSDSGYLVAPEEIASKYTDGTLSLSVDAHANLFQNETSEVVANA